MQGTTRIDLKEYFLREEFVKDFGEASNALNQARQVANGYHREVVKRDKNGNRYATTQRAKSYKGYVWEWI